MSGSTIELRPKAQRISAEERARTMQNLGFGRIFTEHMVTIRYESGAWGSGVLQPYGPLELDPAASVLHYGQAIFEGFKAYRAAGNRVVTFRPDANARRFNASARRLAMPEMPNELFIAAADALVSVERDWVPEGRGESLYIRPLMIATEAALGVRPAKDYLFLLFGSPSGSYFPQGIKPLSVWLCTDYVRASPGGTGAAKCAGNYAASLVAQQLAIDEGCQQVVWLDAVHKKYIEEMGGMNLFFVFQDGDKVTLVTPKLTGSLLPGITRDSILTLAQGFGYTVEERLFSVEEWEQGLKTGKLTEVFACGTAAVITPVGQVKFAGGEWTVHGGETGPVAMRLRETLLGIQHGELPDRYNWVHLVE